MYKRFLYNKATNFLFKDSCKIFTFHRIETKNSNNYSFNEDLKVSKNFFEYFILNHLKEGYEFVSLEELILFKNKFSKKIAITFDDGYKDNFYNAYPILKKYNIPAIIYLSSNFINGNGKFWWFIIDDLIFKYDTLKFGNKSYKINSNLEKRKAFLEIRNFILSQNDSFYHNNFDNLFDKYLVDWKKLSCDLAMTWDHIRELLEDPLIDIGNHTYNHYPINKLSIENALHEIEMCNNDIKMKLNYTPKSFCYPFGMLDNSNFNSENLKLLGFTTGVTTRPFPISPILGFNQYEIDRINVTEDYFK
jgi:peptidoglycan/xylan/chitin deacetylase (PgdA/CDA1 family)